VIHWQRRKKIEAALEAENNKARKKVVLSDKRIADIAAYVKRHFVEAPENSAKPPSAMASKGPKSKAYFSSSMDWMNMLKKKKIRYSPGT